MQRVLGIGGVFLRAKDPQTLTAWYREVLGVDMDEHGQWSQDPGPTVFAAFADDSDYFGSLSQQAMLNFRVADLDAMADQLRAAGSVVDDIQEMEGIGRFTWVRDPEGNKVELWQS